MLEGSGLCPNSAIRTIRKGGLVMRNTTIRAASTYKNSLRAKFQASLHLNRIPKGKPKPAHPVVTGQ